MLLCGFASPAQAGAWLQKPGELQLIVTGLYYQAGSRFDNDGKKVGQRDFTKYEVNPYVEYGLTDNYTLGANVSLQHLDDSTHSRYGLGDIELFVRRKLVQTRRMVVSVQPLFKIPSPQGDRLSSPLIGSRLPDIGSTVQLGYKFKALGRWHYAEAEAGYRYRYGAPSDQYVFNATLGLNIAPDWTVMPQYFQTVRREKPIAVLFTESPRDDYNLSKLQLSAVYQIDPQRAVQFGVFQHVAGTNVGAGGGGLVSLWSKF